MNYFFFQKIVPFQLMIKEQQVRLIKMCRTLERVWPHCPEKEILFESIVLGI